MALLIRQWHRCPAQRFNVNRQGRTAHESRNSSYWHQAGLHHQYFLGLQLLVAVEEGSTRSTIGCSDCSAVNTKTNFFPVL